MSALFAVLILILLMGFGVPIAWSFAGVLAYLTFLYDVNLNTLMLQGFRSMNSVVLVALPLFILAGEQQASIVFCAVGCAGFALRDLVQAITTLRGQE